MGFKDELKCFEENVLKAQKRFEAETITEEDVLKSFVVLNYIRYEKVPDAFLGCSAINLLNTYVKQDDAKIGYRFRRHIYTLLQGIEDINQRKTIDVFYDNGKQGGILMIVFWEFQFSFHCEKKTEEIRRLQKKSEIKWDGIKKQLCAKSIFEFALNSPWISNRTLNRGVLRELVEHELEDYRNGRYMFSRGELIKKSGVKHGEPVEDKYLKNYIRSELEKCKGRPVILIGTFKKAWDKHVTFTTIRPYLQGHHTLTICDHINIFRKDLEGVVDIQMLKKDKKYFIIGFCEPYKYKNRIGVRLATGFKFCPVIEAGDISKIPSDAFSICHRFSIEEYLAPKQKHLLM